MFRTTAATFTALAIVVASPHAGLACDGLRAGPKGTVVSVTDGDTVLLDSGQKVRLIGIQAPKLPLGREGFAAWPKAAEARAALESMALGHKVALRYGGAEQDRYGRVLAHMFIVDANELWTQQAMLEQGMARVYSFADNRACLDDLYAAEAAARAARRGIWADPYYAMRSASRPDELVRAEGRYELVEGRVLNADKAGSLVYLNFGRVWKTDFTVAIDRRGQKVFEDAGIDPLSYEGRVIRVRGWIEDRDGPRMLVTHPEQIEVLAVK